MRNMFSESKNKRNKQENFAKSNFLQAGKDDENILILASTK